jgi:hypothetical protein
MGAHARSKPSAGHSRSLLLEDAVAVAAAFGVVSRF